MSKNLDLHKQQGQFSGIQSSMFDLKMPIFSETFILYGTNSHTFGSKYAIVSDLL